MRKRSTLRARGVSQNDPQEWRALRQGNIALIHSAPTEENDFETVMRANRASSARNPELWINRSLLDCFVACGPRKDAKEQDQCPPWSFFIAASCSGLAAP